MPTTPSPCHRLVSFPCSVFGYQPLLLLQMDLEVNVPSEAAFFFRYCQMLYRARIAHIKSLSAYNRGADRRRQAAPLYNPSHKVWLSTSNFAPTNLITQVNNWDLLVHLLFQKLFMHLFWGSIYQGPPESTPLSTWVTRNALVQASKHLPPHCIVLLCIMHKARIYLFFRVSLCFLFYFCCCCVLLHMSHQVFCIITFPP